MCTSQITCSFRQEVENCASKVAREGKSISCTQSPNLKITLSAINTPHAMKQYFVRWFLSDGNWKCCVSSVRASKLVCLLGTPAGDAFGGRSEHRMDDITVAVAAAFHSHFACVCVPSSDTASTLILPPRTKAAEKHNFSDLVWRP